MSLDINYEYIILLIIKGIVVNQQTNDHWVFCGFLFSTDIDLLCIVKFW